MNVCTSELGKIIRCVWNYKQREDWYKMDNLFQIEAKGVLSTLVLPRIHNKCRMIWYNLVQSCTKPATLFYGLEEVFDMYISLLS
jgi:hypothetical protein